MKTLGKAINGSDARIRIKKPVPTAAPKLCKRGHIRHWIGWRFVCRKCRHRQTMAWRRRNPNHPGIKAREHRRSRNRHIKYPSKDRWSQRVRHLRRHYGIEPGLTYEQWCLVWKPLCAYCGITLNYNRAESLEPDAAVINHPIPIRGGGADTIDNLVSACRACGSKKSYQTWEATPVFVAGPVQEFMAGRSL